MSVNKKTQKKKLCRFLLDRCKELLSFQTIKLFQFGEGFFKLCLCISLMKTFKSSIRLQWWQFPKMYDALSTHVCFYQVTKGVKCDNFAFRKRKSFFKWFNYADSGAKIISYISLQQRKRIFSLKSENVAKVIVQQKILNNGSKWQYAITKLFKSVSGFILP